MMDGKPDLRPCPFCGGNAELKTYRDNLRGDTFAAMCQKTDCPGRTYRKRATIKAAIEAWNRREAPENRALPFSYQYTCRKCGWKTGEQAERFRYCPMCGEPKKEV